MMAALRGLVGGAEETKFNTVTIPQGEEGTVTVLWGTDWHLDHLKPEARTAFFESLRTKKFDLLLLAGDTELAKEDVKKGAQGLLPTLKKLKEVIGSRPLVFICGNHDYYLGSIEVVRKTLEPLSFEKHGILYLKEGRVVELSPNVAIVGQEGWADGRAGNFLTSEIAPNDFFEIEELKVKNVSQIPREPVRQKMQHYADQASNYAEKSLKELFKKYDHVYFITHFPPYTEAHYYNGKPSGPDGTPFFVNQKLGETLTKVMKTFANKQLTVLCGHTHSPCTYKPLPNLEVIVGKSEYESPQLEAAIVISPKQ